MNTFFCKTPNNAIAKILYFCKNNHLRAFYGFFTYKNF